MEKKFMKKLDINFEEVSEIMKMKIQKELYQTSFEDREDLLQEINLMILKTLDSLEIYQPYSLLEIFEQEKIIK